MKEVRREVELSRRRSLKLKAQVDKLQENREGPGWSQHRAKVTCTHISDTVKLSEHSSRTRCFKGNFKGIRPGHTIIETETKTVLYIEVE